MKFNLSHIQFSHCDRKRGIKLPDEPSEELAELVGAILGDGNIHSFKKCKKVRTYMIRIAGDAIKEYDYLTNHLAPICKRLFNLDPTFYKMKNRNAIYLLLYGKTLIKYFEIMGLKSGKEKEAYDFCC